MKVSFRLWGQIRVSAGSSRMEMDLPEGATLDAALDAFFGLHRNLSPHRSFVRAAIGNEYAGGDQIVRPGDEISLIPPVQGG
jgi:MoaE-MoaD fusion protein